MTKKLFYFCIDINNFCANNSISYKTCCFLTKNRETEHTMFVLAGMGGHFLNVIQARPRILETGVISNFPAIKTLYSTAMKTFSMC